MNQLDSLANKQGVAAIKDQEAITEEYNISFINEVHSYTKITSDEPLVCSDILTPPLPETSNNDPDEPMNL